MKKQCFRQSQKKKCSCIRTKIPGKIHNTQMPLEVEAVKNNALFASASGVVLKQDDGERARGAQVMLTRVHSLVIIVSEKKINTQYIASI